MHAVWHEGVLSLESLEKWVAHSVDSDWTTLLGYFHDPTSWLSPDYALLLFSDYSHTHVLCILQWSSPVYSPQVIVYCGT